MGMKNLKINKGKIASLVLTGSLSLAFIGSVCEISLLNDKINAKEMNQEGQNEASLEEYISKCAILEEEVASLEEESKKNQTSENFSLQDLIVMEQEDVNKEKNFYILYVSGSTSFEEIHHDFKALYKNHVTKEHKDWCINYVHFEKGEPLFNYLTKQEVEEISSRNGKVNTIKLDQILNRIREEYQTENKNSKSIVKD